MNHVNLITWLKAQLTYSRLDLEAHHVNLVMYHFHLLYQLFQIAICPSKQSNRCLDVNAAKNHKNTDLMFKSLDEMCSKFLGSFYHAYSSIYKSQYQDRQLKV